MSADYEMYLSGNDSGEVEIICDHPTCMREGRTTEHNPNGLWLQDVGNLPFRPTLEQVATAWRRHITEAHPVRLAERPGGTD